MVILLAAVLFLWLIHAPMWIISIPIACFVVVFGVFIYAYLFFMHKQPDVLRSEHYHLSKMAIEHGMVGDSIHGLIEQEEIGSDQKQLQAQSRGSEGR
jgi:hypothetical protein